MWEKQKTPLLWGLSFNHGLYLWQEPLVNLLPEVLAHYHAVYNLGNTS